jgi:hypothetical protein
MSDNLENQVTCDFFRGSYPARVTVDLQDKKVHFKNCFTRQELLATAEAEFTCELIDILDVREYTYSGSETLRIVTSTGTAVIPVIATGYAGMKELLVSVAKITPAGRAINSPAMIWVYGLGALLGLAGPLVWVLKNPAMRFHLGLLTLICLFTATCGVFLIRWFVKIFDHFWEIDISGSLGLMMLGFMVGLGDGRQVNWWFTGICCLAGFLLGIPAMRKKFRNRQSDLEHL